jgi:hypothetical protein
MLGREVWTVRLRGDNCYESRARPCFYLLLCEAALLRRLWLDGDGPGPVQIGRRAGDGQSGCR